MENENPEGAIRVRLEDSFSADDQEEIVYRCQFLPNVLSCAIRGGRVLVVLADQAAGYPSQDHIAGVIESVKMRKRGAERGIYASSRREPAYHGDVFEAMASAKAVYPYDRGLVAFGPMMTILCEYFDERFCEISNGFKAEPHLYPTLIPVRVLDRCGYFRSFPQFVHFVTHFNEDPDVYRGAAERIHDGTLDIGGSGGWAPCRHVLSPAVCYHSYACLEGRTIEHEGISITAKGKCFRYESGNMRTLERLREFTMREIVFIGTDEYVRRCRAEVIRKAIGIVESHGLCGEIVPASDRFFNDDAKDKRTYQLGFELKYELRLLLPVEGTTMAVTSFNLHEDFFGRTFGIRDSVGGVARSGCIGVGVDRWAYAFLCQYGLSPVDWPEKVRSFWERRST